MLRTLDRCIDRTLSDTLFRLREEKKVVLSHTPTVSFSNRTRHLTID